MKYLLASLLFLSAVLGFGAPPNPFFLPPGSKEVSDITAEDYSRILGYFMVRYGNEVQQVTQNPLLLVPAWESPYFGASAHHYQGVFGLTILGGLARAPGASKNLLATILCHEIGHVLAGEPRQTIPGAEHTSAEGQSDWYAATVCLPEMLKKYPELRQSGIDEEVQKVCANDDRCQQITQSGLEFVRFFQTYSYREFVPAKISTPAPPAPDLLRNTYPSDQCRLDTFVTGALCQEGKSCKAPSCWNP